MPDDSEMLGAFQREEVIPPKGGGASSNAGSDAPSDQPPGESAGAVPPSGRSKNRAGGNGGKGGGPARSTILPRDFPVQPLGMQANKYYFLSARGELTELSAGAMSHRANLVSLLVGARNPMRHLKDLAPPKGNKDTEFNPVLAADKLMRACSELPLYDTSKPIRHFGTWRGNSVHPVVHLGEELETAPEEERRGRMVGGALYPAVPSRSSPADQIADACKVDWVRERIDRFWNWKSADAADLIIGWIGQAALGQFPGWRAHMWIRGKSGAGKTTLLELISALLGGMSIGVKSSASAAAIRQTTNRTAVARIFDEAENNGTGNIEEVIELFRLMSDAAGARVERGTSDHAGIRFELHGAGLLGSIIPGMMAPQDQSRFVILALDDRLPSANPEDDAGLLLELEQDAAELGPQIWRRMLHFAPTRWDKAFRVYSSLVQTLGGRTRAGDTIGALLAGWDLMLFDDPLMDPETGQADKMRIERAKTIAQPLIDLTCESEELGEAERLLRTIYGALLNKDHGGVVTVSELIITIQECLSTDAGDHPNKLLGRLGLRVMPGERAQRDLFIANGQNPLLDAALKGTRWRGGSHRAALDTNPDIRPSAGPVRVDGRPQRGLIVPARMLPGFEEETGKKPGKGDGGDHEGA